MLAPSAYFGEHLKLRLLTLQHAAQGLVNHSRQET